ncbi:hypothetical protein N1495_05485 [Streptococcus didelphis]|uniref:Na+ driven multidrug efflux pump n=1 Tax=Streptococcus didelphis TaxID=102886 RepID=A0ABY9LHG8_9STRE|nr:hypothetical protein [Streptococcus didelphis]WMB28299.1 hypothetical protein N1496_01070 [Streptococcus didelphis]WMB28973.1 hypothetical protein N1495_05485 [Streptococcus didelphis]
MNKNIYNILAIREKDSLFQTYFYEKIQEYYGSLFSLNIVEDIPTQSDISGNYQGIFTFTRANFSLPTLRFSEKAEENCFLITEDLFKEASYILEMSQLLSQFYQKLNWNWLDYYPYQVRIADSKGKFIIHNQQFNGSFFTDHENQLETWIYEEFKKSKQPLVRHFLLANASLDHIYFQSYYALRDQQNNYLGSFDIVQDFKPILAQYLEETAQVIVGWSDVTSGPSISDDI